MSENAAFFIAAQSGVVPLAYGEPGVAKTRTTEAFARSVKRHYECVIASHYDPAELTGYPTVGESHGKKVLSFVPTEWRINLENSPNGGLLHLDEMTDSAPATQAACLQLLTHGVRNTWIVATANPGTCGTNYFDLSPATVNRLCVLEWDTPRATWQSGMLGGFDRLEQNFPILPENWDSLIGTQSALVVSFTTKAQPSLLQKLPDSDDAKAKPWPSLRSWTNAARVLAAAASVGASTTVINQVVAGCVGEAAAIAFGAWLKSMDLPDPEMLLAEPKLYEPPKRGDQAHAALSAVVAAVIRNNSRERWEAAWQVIDKQCQFQPDIAAVIAGPLVDVKNKPDPSCVVPKSVVDKLSPILKGL